MNGRANDLVEGTPVHSSRLSYERHQTPSPHTTCALSICTSTATVDLVWVLSCCRLQNAAWDRHICARRIWAGLRFNSIGSESQTPPLYVNVWPGLWAPDLPLDGPYLLPVSKWRIRRCRRRSQRKNDFERNATQKQSKQSPTWAAPNRVAINRIRLRWYCHCIAFEWISIRCFCFSSRARAFTVAHILSSVDRCKIDGSAKVNAVKNLALALTAEDGDHDNISIVLAHSDTHTHT